MTGKELQGRLTATLGEPETWFLVEVPADQILLQALELNDSKLLSVSSCRASWEQSAGWTACSSMRSTRGSSGIEPTSRARWSVSAQAGDRRLY
jgi:hypothetical protein